MPAVTRPAARVGWAATCFFVGLSLLYASVNRRGPFLAYAGVAVTASLIVHLWHTGRPSQAQLSFARRNAGALLGLPPWFVASFGPPGDQGSFVYVVGLACMLVALLPLRWAWSRASGLVARLWPVREEVVGTSLWLFVRPRSVLLAFAIALAGIALLDPGASGRAASVGLGLLVVVALAYAVRRVITWAGNPLGEGRVWYRRRGQESFVLMDALAGAAIALTAIAVSCEAITTRQRLAEDVSLEAAAREALSQGMETAWGMTLEELAAAEGSARTQLEPSRRLPDAELERTISREEDATLWRVRITVHWKTRSGAVRSSTLETLRSRAGGRR